MSEPPPAFPPATTDGVRPQTAGPQTTRPQTTGGERDVEFP